MVELLYEFWYLWLFILLLAIYNVFKPQIKGWMGEKIITIILSRLPKDQYIVLNNLLFDTENGTTQIDHVIVSVYGIFVIETKNYSGWIFGDEHAKEWTQTIYRSKHRFMNPIHQNFAHIKAVDARITDYPKLPVVGIIAFSPACTLKTKSMNNVVYYQDVNRIIRKYQTKVLDETKLPEVSRVLSDENINCFKNARAHIKEIDNKQQRNKEAVENMKCPKCGGSLILRNGKYGDFYGCSNYPVCKFTKKIEKE